MLLWPDCFWAGLGSENHFFTAGLNVSGGGMFRAAAKKQIPGKKMETLDREQSQTEGLHKTGGESAAYCSMSTPRHTAFWVLIYKSYMAIPSH
jgi:hypothetical protein